MASRTRQKEEARARRLAEEQARAERARRQRRLQMVGGVVLAAVALVAVAIAISSGGGPSGLQKGKSASATVTSVEGLLKGIPQSGNQLGSPTAPVTLYYYGDLECPVCQEFTLSSFPQLVSNDVRKGRVKVIFNGLETATRDASTFQTQQVAALAAGKQNRFWDFAELFYHEQGTEDSGYVTESYLDGLAQQIPGLNYSAWLTARKASALSTQVQTDEQSAVSQGFNATPTLIVQGAKGKTEPDASVPTYSQLEQAITSVA